ncbi:MAG: lysyl endopeptidase [Patiriisocius sp.]|jgi:lysyl endopeptidase
MKKTLTIACLVCCASFLNAQIQYGGTPINWNSKSSLDMEIPTMVMPSLDMNTINAEDAVVDQYKETPYRFGFDHDVNYNFFEIASNIERKNGDKVWRMGINCPKATSINFLFGEFYLPEGGELFIWNQDRTEFLGSFTNANNKEFGSLAIGLIHDDNIVIEYVESAETLNQALLSISQISHGYRPVLNKWEEDKGPFGTSGSCNMNVNCPDGADWEAEKRGVALILNGGNAHCTGSLINNTDEDGAPYFLTAAHCDANEANWVFYFNHEYEGCANSGPALTSQSISGGVQQASTAPSDAHLVLLSSDVPADYDPYFNGWDNSGDPVSLGIGIHHPSGDVKKLAFDDDPLTITQYLGMTANDNFDHWRIELWERATTTEGGSSGSPLFDQDHRIIGQLHGGYANCANSIDDYYGAMHTSWSTLDEFLDPSGSGVSTLDGYGPYDITYANDAQAGTITGQPDGGCEPVPFEASFELKNNGTATLTAATITYSFNGAAQPTINWTGSLAQDEGEDIALGTFNTALGANSIEVNVATAVDDNSNNNTNAVDFEGGAADASGAASINIEILTDDYGAETTWELIAPNGTVVLDGGPYGNNELVSDDYTITSANEGCYEFILYDAFGDGICCGFGEGNYEVTDALGTVMLSGGEFAESVAGLVSMQASLSIDENDFSDAINVYPNPTENILNVRFGTIANYNMEVYNVVGELIMMTNSNGQRNVQLNVNDFASGMYFLQISGEGNNGVKTFTVK